MKTKSKKEFKELSEEQLQEVTGGVTRKHICDPVDDSCPSMKFDKQCNCLG